MKIGQDFMDTLYSNIIIKEKLGDPEVTANLYCTLAYPYWEGCMICSTYICGDFWVTQNNDKNR